MVFGCFHLHQKGIAGIRGTGILKHSGPLITDYVINLRVTEDHDGELSDRWVDVSRLHIAYGYITRSPSARG